VIGAKAIRDMEPNLAPTCELALHDPGDGFRRDTYKLTTSLGDAAIAEGAPFLRAEATGFERENGAIAAVKTAENVRSARLL
jgi:glycine/D-amino acid oxidase-like deaminating enzyme